MGLGQYNSLGEYSGPHTASSVFLILISPCVINKLKTRHKCTLDKGDFDMNSILGPGTLILHGDFRKWQYPLFSVLQTLC